MPLELIELKKGFYPPSFEDRGFLINMNRARWTNNATTEVMSLFRTFAEPYYEMKCPESKESPPEDSADGSDSQAKEDNSNGTHRAPKKSYCIQFAVREVKNSCTCCFIACNLADPADFTHYMFTRLIEEKELPKPRLQFRILPVHRVCETVPKTIEQTVIPLLESTIAVDSYPHRFSLVYLNHSGSADNSITQPEVKSLVRNCVWATNPNCVQCVKYQDYAVVVDIVEPFFFIGVVKDLQRMASYNTWTVKRGFDRKDLGPDSDDDISDDPTLSDEEERERKQRIKRKRQAEEASLAQGEEGVRRKSQRNDQADDDATDETSNENVDAFNGDGNVLDN